MNNNFHEFKWVDTTLCKPPHKITHWDKFSELKNSLSKGWNIDCPVLLGYMFDNYIQLISGSHRWAAMYELNKKIPILLMTYQYVNSLFGTENWIKMVANPPTLKMLTCSIKYDIMTKT